MPLNSSVVSYPKRGSVRNHEVAGSNPAPSTKQKHKLE
jgi:hypothetical protein